MMLAHRCAYADAHGLDAATMGGVVMHTCDNKWCVNPAHLVLADQAANMQDKVSKGRQARGTDHGMSKLSVEAVLAIRRAYVRGNGSELARQYGISRRLVGKIVKREVWSWI